MLDPLINEVEYGIAVPFATFTALTINSPFCVVATAPVGPVAPVAPVAPVGLRAPILQYPQSAQ